MNIEKDTLYEPKFIVFNTKHLNVFTDTEKNILFTLLSKIPSKNNYLVVNQDEPYAEKVWELIRENESKKILEG